MKKYSIKLGLPGPHAKQLGKAWACGIIWTWVGARIWSRHLVDSMPTSPVAHGIRGVPNLYNEFILFRKGLQFKYYWPCFEGIIFEWMDHKLGTLLFIYSFIGCLSQPWGTLSTYITYSSLGVRPQFNSHSYYKTAALWTTLSIILKVQKNGCHTLASALDETCHTSK